MKIAVCFKIVPDYEELPAAEWEGSGEPDFSYTKKMYGCFDEAALEMGLRLKDSCKAAKIPVKAIALTAGVTEGAASENLLKTLYAAGYDRVVVLPGTDPFDPKKAAERLAAQLKKEAPDCLFTGHTVGPGDSGSVPYYLAEALEMPLLNGAADVSWHVQLQRICLIRQTEKSRQTLALNRPCLAVVGDSDHPVLRLYSLRARLDAQKREIEHPATDNAEDAVPFRELVFRTAERPAGSCCFPDVRTPAEKALFLEGLIKGEARG